MTVLPSEVRVLVFARAPEPGRTKTRLMPVLGADGAADLQARFTRHTLRTAMEADIGEIELWCAPHTSFTFFDVCQQELGVRLRAQGPGDLGTRLLRAFRETLTRAPAAMVIGTDCPALRPTDLERAAEALSRNDAVLGPAEDGGYVLIGLRQGSPRLFERIDWGTSSVLDQTRERLRDLGWRWSELPTLWDVDRPEDYDRLARDPALGALAYYDAA
jgi:uncharacterized protein